MKNRKWHFATIALFACLSALITFWGCGSSDDDSDDEGTDAGGDTDTDSDSDADTDTDTDADSDADSDVDADTDSDMDADTDTDTDGDTDTDSDTDADTDGDTDENLAPMPEIENPEYNEYFSSNESIEFEGKADDPEDGELVGTSLRWLDNGDQMGFGESLTTALPDGTHVITLEATDSMGLMAFTALTIHVVPNQAPECEITDPDDGDEVDQGDNVDFEADCSDPDGGQIPDGDISWTSDLEGHLGNGDSIRERLEELGEHTIEVCAKDTTDPTLEGCADIKITVVD